MLKHEIDIVTDWCLKCGQSMKDITEEKFECRATENVVAISHRVRGQILRRIAGC